MCAALKIDQEWYGIALDYAREYGELRNAERARDAADRLKGEPVTRAHPAYRARVPFRACYEALKEAGYGEDAASEARRLADKAYAVACGGSGAADEETVSYPLDQAQRSVGKARSHIKSCFEVEKTA